MSDETRRAGHSDDAPAGRPAGPVGAGDPPPPPVAEASSGAVPPTPPPAGEAEEVHSPTPPAGGAEEVASPAAEAEGGGSRSSEGEAEEVERDFDALLEDAKRERDEYLELAKRTKADFENYRRRMASEVEAAGSRGKADAIRQVVPVLDDLERAIAAAGLDPEGDSEDALAHGVLLVFRGLRDALGRNGVEAVDPKGDRFDPNLHEALSTQPFDGAEAGTVVEVMQKGYRLGEQLIRPARVVVAE